jgi:hypothetical protein
VYDTILTSTGIEIPITQKPIQELFWELYDGIEKWQRLDVYEEAMRSGLEHSIALTKAVNCPIADLPEIVFKVGATIEAPSREECDRMLAEVNDERQI